MDTQTQNSSFKEPDLSLLAVDAIVQNGLVVEKFIGKTMGVKLDIPSLIQNLDEQVSQMKGGDKSKAETLLYSQAMTLNAIFLEMARRAAMNMNDHIHATETYMRMALKAQNQVRLTLETISNLKTPSLVIAKQTNICNGSQQISNLLTEAQPTQIQPNQLSGESYELRENAGTQSPSRKADSALEALGAINRSNNSRG